MKFNKGKLFSLLYCIIVKFKLSQINLGEIVYFNGTTIKIVLILLDNPLSQCTDVKTCFLILWFNCEFMIETDNENIKQNAPTIHDFRFSKQNAVYVLFSKKGKELM